MIGSKPALKIIAMLLIAALPVVAQQEQAKDAAKTKAQAKAKAKNKAAGPNQKAFQRIVQELDANMDETLHRHEVPESARAEFDELVKLMDENGDKALSRGELQAAGAKMQRIFAAGGPLGKAGGSGAGGPPFGNPEERFKLMDKNGDGAIARDEWMGVPENFDRMDRNGDSKLSAGEQKAAIKQIQQFTESLKKKAS